MSERKMYMGVELRVGYLVPEFPGQTHGFFWREWGELKRLHVSADMVSTRRPAHQSAKHEWAAGAEALTTYLTPLSVADMARITGELLRVSPRAAAGMLRVVREAMQGEAHTAIRGTRLRALISQVGWLAMGARLAALARERNWHHVHVHSCGNSAYVAMYANLVAGLPYSLTLHGPLDDYGANQNLKWAHAAFAIIITEGLRRDAVASLGPCMPKAIEVTPMGVDVDAFSRDGPYEPWSGNGPFRIFSCGRLNKSKGHDVLLDALYRIVRSGADVHLAIAGEDEDGGNGYRQVLLRRIDELGLGDRVRLLGAVSAASVRKELSRAHVFALASHAEPLGVAIMEAMAMAVPVIATAAGGVPELVDDRVNGLLVEPGSPELIRDAMVQIMEQPSLSLKLGDAGRRRVKSSFGHQESAGVLAALLRAAAPSRVGSFE